MTFQKYILLIFGLLTSNSLLAQPANYYNGTEGLSGDQLKEALHDIIKNHIDFSYNFSRSIMEYTDQDPDNSNNVILFYLQESRDASQYGTGGDYINREHVWAKSHGNFSGVRPMDSDVHNLHPADASVNEDRGNKDFDNIHELGIGTQHAEATACYYTDSTWEPGPLTKGQVARALFYMATRYEGDNGEMDLELVRHNNNYPNPLHGNLNALLEWNRQYPPSDFERRRNERLFRIQQNRNPFVDHPEFADFIWSGKTPSGPTFSNIAMSPDKPLLGETLTLSVQISTATAPSNVVLYWGKTSQSTENQSSMTASDGNYSASVSPSGFSAGDMVYFTIAATVADSTYLIPSTYIFPETVTANAITSIPDVQGTGTASTMQGQQVTIAGRITANFDNQFYMQTSDPERSGINVYNSLFRGQIGDSIIVTGTVSEYQNLTEITDVSYNYNYKSNQPVEPKFITTPNMSEMYEGMLVTIQNASFSQAGTTIPDAGGSYTFTDSYGSGTLYIGTNTRLIGETLPSGKINITGVLGQYGGTYQLLPRDINDFALYTSNTDIKQHEQIATIYPNPVQNRIYFETNNKVKEVSIYYLTGQKLIHKYNPGTSIQISSLMEGTYLMVIQFEDGGIQTEKIVKISSFN